MFALELTRADRRTLDALGDDLRETLVCGASYDGESLWSDPRPISFLIPLNVACVLREQIEEHEFPAFAGELKEKLIRFADDLDMVCTIN